jgi:glutaredoxin
MINLFVKTNCPFSARAISALDAYNVPFLEKNIADPGVEEELIKIGGRHKVPFLVDGDVHIYESEDIVAYVEKKFGPGVEHILDTSEGGETNTM